MDESQFLPSLPGAAETLLGRGARIVCAGLSSSGTLRFRAFEPVSRLLPMADSVRFLKSQCKVCGQETAFFRRLADADREKYEPLMSKAEYSPSLIGGLEAYGCFCRQHLEDPAGASTCSGTPSAARHAPRRLTSVKPLMYFWNCPTSSLGVDIAGTTPAASLCTE